MKTKFLIAVSYFLLLSIFGHVGCTGDENLSQKNKTRENSQVGKSAKYSIESKEDISIRTLSKNPNEYTSNELAKLPINKRMKYKIVVASNIKYEQVKPTIEEIINDITSSDNDIDEITMFLYSDKQITNQAYDVAMAEWVYLGEWGKVTPEIVTTNNRSNYKINIFLKDNLEQYLQQRSKKETLFNLREETRRSFYKELCISDTKAFEEAERLYSTNVRHPGYSKDNILKNADKVKELMKEYSNMIRSKYNISEEVEQKIFNEASKENWPME